MSHPSPSLFGRTSVGVQKRSDRVNGDPNGGLAARVRAGVASSLKYAPVRRYQLFNLRKNTWPQRNRKVNA
jgi:hypothetical protein